MDELLKAPVEPVDLALRHVEPTSGHISIENLAFRYAPNLPPVFEGFNLEIRPGQCVLLAGPSGAGKSTLARLLLGFRQPDAGTIRIDGRDTTSLPVNVLRNHFGVVLQDTVLFAGTLLENLELASPGVAMDEIVTACRLAGIHDAITALPEGYQSRIGEHGVGLSGGQRQRLAIARALLRRPAVLVFDEACSHLDASSADEVVKALNALSGKVSVLFIAHEAPPGLRFDKVEILRAAPVRKVA
jgi:subfamily B ATP-binding cassette protein HlyB/CyaB